VEEVRKEKRKGQGGKVVRRCEGQPPKDPRVVDENSPPVGWVRICRVEFSGGTEEEMGSGNLYPDR
jgi:hypothetical protein